MSKSPVSTIHPVPGYSVLIFDEDSTQPGTGTPAASMAVSSTRRRLSGNRRCSRYVHSIVFTLYRDDGPPMTESAIVRTSGHPLVDPFDYVERLLRQSHWLRAHSQLVKRLPPPPSAPHRRD